MKPSLSSLFSFKGTADRVTFWTNTLLSIVVSILGMMLMVPLTIAMSDLPGILFLVLTGILYTLLMIPVWLMSIAVTVRRFHDRGKSGWWALLTIVPFGIIWVIIECGFLPGINEGAQVDQKSSESEEEAKEDFKETPILKAQTPEQSEEPSMTPQTTPSSSLSIPMAIIIAGLAIAGAIYFGQSSNRDALPQDISQKTLPNPISNKDHILGNPNAKIMIVEYSDTECPYCKAFHNTMNSIMSTYGQDGNVAWVYRHFPFHKLAPREAEATECAAKLGGNEKFWEYLGQLFIITKADDNLDVAELPKIATAIGLNESDFLNCLNSGEMKPIIEEHKTGGIKAGVRGTPHSLMIVNGKVVDVIGGNQSYETVKAQIDAILK